MLPRNSLITPRAQRRAVPAWRRFERYAPHDLWQIDGTQVALTDGSVAWLSTFSTTMPASPSAPLQAGGSPPPPRGDHGSCHRRARRTAAADQRQRSAVISRDGHKPVHFQQRLAAMGIRQLSSRPAHPQTCGKLERYHRTFKDLADHGPAATIDELQALCDRFRWQYNHQQPHQSLGQKLPAEVYQALPKVDPGDPRPRRLKTGHGCSSFPTGSVHYRKRKIGVGMHWKGQKITVIELQARPRRHHRSHHRSGTTRTDTRPRRHLPQQRQKTRPAAQKRRIDTSAGTVSDVLKTTCQGCPRSLFRPPDQGVRIRLPRRGQFSPAADMWKMVANTSF